MRAPFCALSIVMFVTETFATMSVSPAYCQAVGSGESGERRKKSRTCPRLPTEMPCEPLHHMLATTMLVLFGLNAVVP